jgi:hypothetical protein
MEEIGGRGSLRWDDVRSKACLESCRGLARDFEKEFGV